MPSKKLVIYISHPHSKTHIHTSAVCPPRAVACLQANVTHAQKHSNKLQDMREALDDLFDLSSLSISHRQTHRHIDIPVCTPCKGLQRAMWSRFPFYLSLSHTYRHTHRLTSMHDLREAIDELRLVREHTRGRVQLVRVLKCMRKACHCPLKDSTCSILSHGHFLYISVCISYIYIYTYMSKCALQCMRKECDCLLKGPTWGILSHKHYLHIYIHIYTYIYTYTYKHIYIHIYTYSKCASKCTRKVCHCLLKGPTWGIFSH